VSLNLEGDQNPENNHMYFSINSGGMLPKVIINEVLFHPRNEGCEWIEVYNRGGTPVNLSGWAISDTDSVTFHTLTDERLFLPVKGFLVIAKEAKIIQEQYTLGPKDVITPKNGFPSLNNGGDTVRLHNEYKMPVDEMMYGKDADKGPGISLERIDSETSGILQSNWGNSGHYRGATPARENSLAVKNISDRGGIHLSPNPFSPDNDGFNDRMKISVRTLYRHSWISLVVYNLKGRVVRHIAVNRETGQESSFIWDGRDNHGAELYPGMYIVHLNIREHATDRTSHHKSVAVLATGR
jgi:hypothetical protein